MFSVTKEGKLDIQSGVPPDYFSETGQLWGTPVYRWERHQLTHFDWWRRRFARHLQQVDLLRLDHFRALESYWEVPGSKETAEEMAKNQRDRSNLALTNIRKKFALKLD